MSVVGIARRLLVLLVAVAAAIALVVGGSIHVFGPSHPYPDPPSVRSKPAIAAEIVERKPDFVVLIDGTTHEVPLAGSSVRGVHGGSFAPGSLYLGGDDPEPWAASIDPLPQELCPWPIRLTGDAIAWDMTSSVLFESGLELAKAPAFKALSEPRDVNGHSAWTYFSGGPTGFFCVDRTGAVEYGG